MHQSVSDQINTSLKKYWGYDAFRPTQEEIVRSVLEKSDTIALLPTGGGKSLCFQLPAIMLEGKTLVVSPLIALMQDQVNQLAKRGIKAAFLHSGRTFREIDMILDNFIFGDLKLLYIAPERIDSDLFMTRISRAKLGLIAIDEAHCVSQWGYDFRPAYFNIPRIREIHPNIPVIALTATATPKVIEDISEKLKLVRPAVFRKSFAREKLSLSVIITSDKKHEVFQLLQKVKGNCILYARNRRQTLELSQWLQQRGMAATAYHGGMDKGIREKNQALWMNGMMRIMVATNAFGMGIDKADVRLVVHLDIPSSLEEYYQEAGRAGRDNLNAYAVTIIDEADFVNAESAFADQFPSIEIISGVYDRLCRYFRLAYGSGLMERFDFRLSEFSEYLNIPARKVYTILQILEKEGWLFLSESLREPSRVMVMSSQDEIRDTDSTSTSGKVLVQMLRRYEGLFTDFVKIDEAAIARQLSMETSKVRENLTLLHAEGVIQYVRQSSEPQIIFTRERPPIDSFFIDKKAHAQRKKTAKERLDAMIAYLRMEEGCRQAFISCYFGEKGQPCRMCDLCLGAYEEQFSPAQLDKILLHLKQCTSQAPVDVKSYAARYPLNKRKRIVQAIHTFAQEGLITINNSGLITGASQ
jgi:ATP-dependent DNA helicase RecQ